MNSNKFYRQIRREARSHPTKAALLGILAAVAICYWASLFWSWTARRMGEPERIGSISEKDKQIGGLPANLDPKKILDAELTKNSQTQNETKKYDWQQILQWMKDDPRSIAAEALPGRADAFEDPFALDEKVAEEKTKQKIERKTVKLLVRRELTPQQLEIKLSSTLVGPGDGIALINGKTYRVGRSVSSEKDRHQTAFILTEIHEDHVVLSRNKKKYKLLLPKKETSGNVSIEIKK